MLLNHRNTNQLTIDFQEELRCSKVFQAKFLLFQRQAGQFTTVCRVLSCSSDYLLFGDSIDSGAWSDTISKLEQLDLKYKEPVSKTLQGLLEAIVKAKQ